jgi:D-alanyl-D-alanine carboxypeptidase
VQQTVSDWRLLLVNDWNAIDANYEKSVTMVSAGKRGQKADSRILADLNAMLAAGAEYGIDVQSGYRSYDHQSTLYWRQVNNFKNNGYNDTAAQTAAGKIVKRPGYSEHNSGLAVDLGGSGNFLLDESFANTAAYKWLIENCADYGFILRFPKDKEEITGVIYEAWHFRYVGKEAATYIMANNLCLEEYLEQQGL